MLEEIVGVSAGMLAAFFVGYNVIGIPEKLGSRFLTDAEGARNYEQELKQKRNTLRGFPQYYFGYFGRKIAYRQIKKTSSFFS